ncbi:MAG: hypothetical protein JWR72_3296 [Flavisolibacter sp.]|nr:hypothetical protein [Flavisolibacter sp.]
MPDKAFITPKVLRWARESARMSLEAAAKKVPPVSAEKLGEWEEGLDQPTVRQAETLANAYKRPFAVFFLPEVPRDFDTLRDFRRNTAKQLSTASIFIIREIQQKQAWISEMFEENKETEVPFVGKFSLQSQPQTIAKDILQTLKIEPGKYKIDNPIREWIDAAEGNGIFVSRTSFIHSKLKIDSEEIQGFAIADSFAPFIFINSDDWNAPQLFSLVHELAHIWIAESGVSNDIELNARRKESMHPVELFCNEIAANALMPTEIMRSYNADTFNSSVSVFKVAKSIGVSSFAFLVRALNLNLISMQEYTSLKRAADREFQIFLQNEESKKLKQKEQKGGPNPYLLRLNKNSKLFTQIVLDAFRGGAIEPTQASRLLNTQVNNFPKLEAFLYK